MFPFLLFFKLKNLSFYCYFNCYMIYLTGIQSNKEDKNVKTIRKT